MQGPRPVESAHVSLSRQTVDAGPSAWRTIVPVWSDLIDRTRETSAFLSEEWVGRWFDRFGERFHTFGLIWSTSEGEPVACALLTPSHARIGPLRVSTVRLNASGAHGFACEINDVVTLPEYRSDVVADLTDFLASQPTDQIRLEGVRQDLFQQILGRWPSDRWRGIESESPYVNLDRLRRSGEDYLSTLSSNTRSQIRRSIRKYEDRLGGLRAESASGAAQALDWFAEMLDLHDRRWRSVGEPSGFTQDARDFHADLISEILSRESSDGLCADLTRVTAGSETIGILYHLVLRGHVHFYQSGFLYHDDSHLKPGLVSHALSIEDCIRSGHGRYDFLGGEAEPVRYKRSLSTDAEILYWATLPNGTLRESVLSTARRVKDAVRKRLGEGS